MGKLKSEAKKTRQQRLASVNQQLLDQLNRVEREAGRFEKALLEYAKESNWHTIPKSTDGQETTQSAVEASEVIVASEEEISAWPECAGCGGKVNPDYGKCIRCG